MNYNIIPPQTPWVNPDGTPTGVFYRFMVNLFASAGSGGDLTIQDVELLNVLELEPEPVDLRQAMLFSQVVADVADAFGVTKILAGTGIAVTHVNTVYTVALATIPNLEVLANISGGVAAPTPQTLTAVLDAVMGSSRGDLIYRGASNWAALPLGSNGYVLQSNGTDVLWGTVSAGSLSPIADATILSNVSGVSASPSANTLTQVIDHDTGGAARGAVLVRGASAWGNLPLGASGYVVTSNGTDALWSPVALPAVADATLISNISGGSAVPVANTLTAILDHDMGAVRGEILYRGAANWAVLGLGSNGQVLQSNGTDILWGATPMPSIADATILSNVSGGAAVATANSLTAILDHDMGSARGDIVYRGASNWAALVLGSTGQMLRSNGTDITWASSIGYAGDQSYQTAGWATGNGFSTNCSLYTSATTGQAALREILAGVYFLNNKGGNQASSPTRDKVAFSAQVESSGTNAGDQWSVYPVNILAAGTMAVQGYSAFGIEVDVNNNSGVDLSNFPTIGGHVGQAYGVAVTGSSANPCTAAFWATGASADQWDKGLWITANSVKTASIRDEGHATQILYDAGTHTYGINLLNGTQSFPFAANQGSSTFGIVIPYNDNTFSCGTSINRWTAVWAVNGTIQTSDPSLKTDMKPLPTDLGPLFEAISPITFKWIDGGNDLIGNLETGPSHPGRRTHWGFDARQVGQAFKGLGLDFGGYIEAEDKDGNTSLHLRFDQFHAILWQEVKNLRGRLATLEKGTLH